MSEAEFPGESLFRFPTDQRSAWEWAFRFAMIAAYCYIALHFVSMERYERDAEKMDAKLYGEIKQLGEIHDTLVRLDERMKRDDIRDVAYEKLEARVRGLEDKSYASH